MTQSLPAYRKHRTGQAFVQHKSIERLGNRLCLGKPPFPAIHRWGGAACKVPCHEDPSRIVLTQRWRIWSAVTGHRFLSPW
jgi:hypothetical protein